MSRFKVGDEVIYKDRPTKFVITSIIDGKLNGIGLNGVAFCDKNAKYWQKTGKHFPEAEKLMKALAKSKEEDKKKEEKSEEKHSTFYLA